MLKASETEVKQLVKTESGADSNGMDVLKPFQELAKANDDEQVTEGCTVRNGANGEEMKVCNQEQTSERDTEEDSDIAELCDSVKWMSTSKDILNQLNTLCCPFTWNLKDAKKTEVAKKLAFKEEQIKEDWSELLLQKFGVQLALCFEKWSENDFEEAYKHQNNCEDLIDSLKDVVFVDGLKYLSSSCLAFLCYFSNKLKDCYTILTDLKSFEKLSDVSKACVIGMRGIVLMEYGPALSDEAIKLFEEALSLDQSNADWHFQLGKALRRKRRRFYYNELPEDKELNAFTQAAKISHCPLYKVFLALSLTDMAYIIKKHKSGFYSKKVINELNRDVIQLFRDALQQAPDSLNVNVRCAEVLLKLPASDHDDIKLETCIENALKVAPEYAMAHHYRGKYKERINEIEEAKYSYRKGAEYGAYGSYMSLLSLEFKTNHNYDPMPLMNEMLDTYSKDWFFKIEILYEIAAYYFLKHELIMAVTYFLQIVEKKKDNHDSSPFKIWIPACSYQRLRLNLLGHLLRQTQQALRDRNLSCEEKYLYKKLNSKYEDFMIFCQNVSHSGHSTS